MDVQSFNVDVAEAVLQDLQARLERTRWPDEVEDAGWEYGVPLGYLKDMVAYWRDGFDWRAQEARLNRVHHYRAQVEGFGIHFVHEPGKGPNPLPLLITHGWPSSFVEMLDLLPLLTDPASHGGNPVDAFDVVVPSLPGYGFSDRPAHRGTPGPWHELWAALMEGLGYERYGMHAGDV
ncbi:MAG TPA: epoxide hydrolase N-terminal domain-containing protein, partial [Herpetosiphonaceae bacterium]|nr:epoxide hydrolase N-terminal domain-containing protein [Herpetosiphonaceae bacterium]